MRMNIYVGDDLRKRMDKVKEPVNWSQVACQAFEAQLAEIASRKKDKTMDDVIQRLRVSKAQNSSADEKAGRAAGERWAKHRAQWSQLEAFAKFATDMHEAGYGFDDMVDEESPGPSLLLKTFGGEMDQRDLAQWWKDEVENGNPSSEFAFGFYEAALAVWEEVESKL